MNDFHVYIVYNNVGRSVRAMLKRRAPDVDIELVECHPANGVLLLMLTAPTSQYATLGDVLWGVGIHSWLWPHL